MKKKRVALFLIVSMLISLTACVGSENEPSSQSIKETSNSVSEQQSVKLENHMTEKEKSSISVGEFSLLDTKNEPAASDSSVDNHTVQIDVCNDEDNLENINAVVIDGRLYSGFMPPLGYDGGYLNYVITSSAFTFNGSVTEQSDTVNSENVPEPEEIKFNSFEEFKTWYREDVNEKVSSGMLTQEEADQEYEDMLVIFDSVINNTYEVLDEDVSNEDYYSGDDLKKNWEFNSDEVSKITDSIKEISVYDEELDTTFIVHVTLPPGFDKSKTYPMFVMTDGVWRFGDHPALRKMMENNEAEDVILVSIGYDFSIDGTDNGIRGKYFCDNKEKFMGFITDNLMPYLNEEYSIDFEKSTLYGHSLGGVFTHYAAFNSDSYENQPFHNYIIGSPAFWSPYFENNGEYKSEYGYFDRNDKLDKSLYISGGENEDPDYEEYYGENDSTLEGISNLMDRLEKYGVTSAECKIYEDSNHYEYIPDMFRTFFLEYYKK